MNRGAFAILLCACSAPSATQPDAAKGGDSATPDAATAAPAALEMRSLGVQGFVIHYGNDSIMTAPLFTRQSAIEVSLNLPMPSDTAAIDSHLADVPLGDLRAIVTGHAHYDHFLDVPHVMEKAPGATLYTNMTGAHILAALAPDRPGCTNAQPTPMLPRSRVVALDDALASHVDYTNCPDQRPAGAPMEGSWVQVPNSHVRILPVCSMHPAQVGPYHFGAGSIDHDQCSLPSAASGWLEGQTLGLLIDFLDDNGKPAFRIFYQDAPTDAPIGFVPAAKLAEKAVDVDILCVGSADSVTGYPGNIIGNTQPRFALSGHWEDFFQSVDSPPQPIPLLDVPAYVSRAEAALPGPADAPILVDGEVHAGRHVLVNPGSRFVVPPAP